MSPDPPGMPDPLQLPEPPRPTEASNLLFDLLRSPLDPGYLDAARRRAEVGPRTGWRLGTARGAQLITVALVGLLLAIAYQQVVAGEPATTKARADLLADVRAKRAASDALQDHADALRDSVARAGDAAIAGDENADVLRSQAAIAGVGRIRGAGVIVRLTDAQPQVDPVTGKVSDDNPGVVLDRDLQDIANALWSLGAEAIAINGQRLTATTAIRAAGGAILVDFRPITSPYQIVAIGPGGLAGNFNDSAIARRFRRYVKAYRMGFSIKKRADLTLAAAPEPRLRYAHLPSTPARGAPAGPAGGTSPGSQAGSGTGSQAASPSPPLSPAAPPVGSGTGR